MLRRDDVNVGCRVTEWISTLTSHAEPNWGIYQQIRPVFVRSTCSTMFAISPSMHNLRWKSTRKLFLRVICALHAPQMFPYPRFQRINTATAPTHISDNALHSCMAIYKNELFFCIHILFSLSKIMLDNSRYSAKMYNNIL